MQVKDSAELLSEAEKVKQMKHHIPISDYSVGAVLTTDRGDFHGMNLEIEGVGLYESMHAEQSAVHHAISEGAVPPFHSIAITDSPCGLCRQFMVETGSVKMPVILKDKTMSLGEYLPNAFTPATVGKPLLGQVPAIKLKPTCELPTELHKTAHMMCNRSQSSWMRAPAAVALQHAEGIVSGVFLESVAHNPSVNPATGAVNKLLLKGISPSAVTKAVLAYVDTPTIDHKFNTIRILQILCGLKEEDISFVKEDIDE
eukprot:TRINITY_DN10254_c0_g1_i1.p1 TRINITY_DN10254_c0_g1~~TRINITY_DN10254_c0_g1_i1.p1  ORF type:complete len:257 (+),score=54.64 TRINITY_DN10254_c0_g1_i1:63-833(+)